MRLRRAGSLVLALSLAACTKVTQSAPPASFVIATFNSDTGAIPLPNDLALQGAPAVLPLAQREVLQAFIRGGGFPNDQEVPVQIPFSKLTWSAEATTAYPYGHYVTSAPDLDLATVTATTVLLLRTDVSPPAAVAYEKAYNSTTGVLSLRKPAAANGTRHWDGGRYVVAVRGGKDGVKTTDGTPIDADLGIFLAVQGKDLSNKANQPPGMTAAQAAQAEGLRQALTLPLDWSATSAGLWAAAPSTSVTPAFTAIDATFPHAEAVSVATFAISKDATVHVALDAGAGEAPFPSDFMLTTDCAGGQPRCLSASVAPAFGAAAAGLRTLDGFSTTALLLAPLTGLVDATTITAANVHLFELPAGANPVKLKDLAKSLPTGAGAAYVTQPSQLVATVGTRKVTSTLALAPAVPADLSALGLGKFALPPLKEKSTYAVVITNRVKDLAGNAITRGTVAKLLLETTAPLAGTVSSTNTSFVAGVDYATAAGLQAMRDGLAPFLTALPLLTAGATTKADVAMVYTIHTQSVTGTSLSLSAAPLSIEKTAATAIFAVPAAPTPVATAPTIPGVTGFFSVPFMSVDGIDKTTGTFRATLAADLASPTVLPTLLAPLTALVAVPDVANVPFCSGTSGPRCAKLVVFGHGLNGNKTNLYGVAASLAARGYLAAAIDFPLHGDRNWCAADADCASGGTCLKTGAFAASAGQGDCGSLDPASAACTARRPGVCSGALPVTAGSRYFIGANFFRIRDAFRQNLFDQAALMLALARPPAPWPQPSANALTGLLAAVAPGVVVDPSTVYYEGLSLGSIAGTSVMATNPRVSRGVLSVGGGTAVDVFSTSPSFQGGLDVLLAGLIPGFTRPKVTPGDPAFDATIAAEYLQLLQVAKWIIDPADPINYAGHVRTSPLPNLLAAADGSVAQTAKDVFAQIALGDTVVPNATNFELDALLAGPVTTYDLGGGTTPAPHSMLAQSVAVATDAAAFLADPSVVPPATKSVTIP